MIALIYKPFFIVGFLLLLVISCSFESNNASNENVDFCYEEGDYVAELIRKCGETPSFHISCNTYKDNGSYDSYKQCMETLDALSCDDLVNIKNEDDLSNIEGCFDFIKKTKEDVCFSNHIGHCENMNSTCNDDDKLPENCYKVGNHIDDEGRTIPDFNEDKVKEYCEGTINGNNDISGVEDFFYKTCGDNYQVDCNNIQEIDFRNEDWKNLCIQE